MSYIENVISSVVFDTDHHDNNIGKGAELSFPLSKPDSRDSGRMGKGQMLCSCQVGAEESLTLVFKGTPIP